MLLQNVCLINFNFQPKIWTSQNRNKLWFEYFDNFQISKIEFLIAFQTRKFVRSAWTHWSKSESMERKWRLRLSNANTSTIKSALTSGSKLTNLVRSVASTMSVPRNFQLSVERKSESELTRLSSVRPKKCKKLRVILYLMKINIFDFSRKINWYSIFFNQFFVEDL